MDQGRHILQKEKKSNKNKYNSAVKDSLKVKFLGVRGTMPAPYRGFLKYGGNTSCVEITSQYGKEQVSLLFDAGTGIVKHAEQALLNGVRVFYLFLSHMHYDHIMGLTKFVPLFRLDCEIHIYGYAKCGLSLKEILEKYFVAPFFPVEFNKLPSINNLYFHELNRHSSVRVGHVQVEFQPLHHPQGAVAYKVWNYDKSSSVVYATDHEHGSKVDTSLKKFLQNVNLLIYDSTYSNMEYNNYVGWGHSTSFCGAHFAKDCKVKNYALFHHDPSHNDKHLEEVLLPEAKKIFKKSFLAKENMIFQIK